MQHLGCISAPSWKGKCCKDRQLQNLVKQGISEDLAVFWRSFGGYLAVAWRSQVDGASTAMAVWRFSLLDVPIRFWHFRRSTLLRDHLLENHSWAGLLVKESGPPRRHGSNARDGKKTKHEHPQRLPATKGAFDSFWYFLQFPLCFLWKSSLPPFKLAHTQYGFSAQFPATKGPGNFTPNKAEKFTEKFAIKIRWEIRWQFS